MKKNITLFAVLALVLSACADKNAYQITGTVPASVLDNSVVYLQKLDADLKTRQTIDTAIVKKGAFVFEGVAAEKPAVAYISLAELTDDIKQPLAIILEPGKMEVAYNTESTIIGSELNVAYNALNAEGVKYNSVRRAVYRKMMESPEDSTLVAEVAELDKLENTYFTNLKTLATNNMGTQLGVNLLVNNSYMFSLPELEKAIPLIATEYLANEKVLQQKKRMQALDATQVGKLFTDLKGQNIQGQEVSLSDYAGKGKYVVVDFWASWCPPCRHETPRIVDLYKQYRYRGLEVVGVSIDHEVDKWEQGVKDLGVLWSQISDLKGWESELSGAYGVNTIPHMVLLDKDGVILARGFNAEELKVKLEELLK